MKPVLTEQLQWYKKEDYPTCKKELLHTYFVKLENIIKPVTAWGDERLISKTTRLPLNNIEFWSEYPSGYCPMIYDIEPIFVEEIKWYSNDVKPKENYEILIISVNVGITAGYYDGFSFQYYNGIHAESYIKIWCYSPIASQKSSMLKYIKDNV